MILFICLYKQISCKPCQPCCNTVECWVPPFNKKRLSPCANLTITVRQEVNPGDPSIFSYIFTVTNTGPVTATNVVITVQFTGVPIDPGSWTFTNLFPNSPATFNAGDFPPNTTVLSIPLTFAVSSSSTVTATLTSDTRICNPSLATVSDTHSLP